MGSPLIWICTNATYGPTPAPSGWLLLKGRLWASGECRVHSPFVYEPWYEVCVLLQREGHGAVAELGAHCPRVDPLQKEDAAAGVTGRGVEGGLRQTHTFEQGLERRVRCEGLTGLPAPFVDTSVSPSTGNP